MNSDFDRPQPDYSQARQEAHDRAPEHPAANAFRPLMASVRRDVDALKGEVYERCFQCGYHHVRSDKCGKAKG